jgi:hypothetical protein
MYVTTYIADQNNLWVYNSIDWGCFLWIFHITQEPVFEGGNVAAREDHGIDIGGKWAQRGFMSTSIQYPTICQKLLLDIMSQIGNCAL